ncbi:unnamed protein product [Tuber aestivum]|uniref:RNase MRP protein 1 RNA binding domain-containing protein n=1 Tax=Tuber aestivum TaxID=59557 RepID=A0A292PYS1_9PEZI|nr:unnamed protein product [Tuber aestivum]
MSTNPTPAPPPPDIKTDLALLNTLHARNKNQHRSSKWYKWFSILRRNLKKLVAGDQLEARKRFVRRAVVPRCFIAFSTVIANNRYVSLGLVLMGVLAGVNRFVGEEPVKVVKERAAVREETEVEKRWDEYAVSLEDFGEAVIRDSVEVDVGETIRQAEGGRVVRDEGTVSPVSRAIKEDNATAEFDEAVTLSTTESERAIITAIVGKPLKKKRKRIIEDLSSPREESPSLLAQPQPVPVSVPLSGSISPEPELGRSKKDDAEPRRKKGKRKKRDEIDDLFAGL